jgi:hypothetical protein
MLDEETSQSKIRLKTKTKFGQYSVRIRLEKFSDSVKIPKFGWT